MTIERMLVASTANIELHTAHVLDGTAEDTSETPISYEKDEYGWFFPILPNGADVPPELAALMTEATRLGCTWLMLDRDAPPLPGFPTFDW